MGARVEELGAGRMLIDLGFRDTVGLVACYVLPGPEGYVLVETGPSSSREALRIGLSEAGVAPGEVEAVFVTHIHLDHAGGLGAVAEMLPRARLLVHRSGVPHMLDPTRLVASARRAWGAAADPIWGPIRPVPPDRLVALDGGERWPLRDGTLEVLSTPGHARHHLSFFDTARRALLTGDSAGVRLHPTDEARPAVPPPDLDLEELFQSLDRMAALEPRELWYTHFGPAPASAGVFSAYRTAVERWKEVALEVARRDPDPAGIARALRAHDAGVRPGGSASSEDAGALVSSYEMAAQGLLRYLRMRGLLPAEGL